MEGTVVDRYKNDIISMYMQTHPDVDRGTVAQLIDQLMEKSLTNIPCVMHNNVYHETIRTDIVNVFDWIGTRNPIITGNGTFFKQHKEYTSPSIKMLEYDMAFRDKQKTKMKSFPKGSPEYINYYTGQNNTKKIMNADYGAAGARTAPFFSIYIPPATTAMTRNMTTTLICCLEMLSSNNDKWGKINHINELFDMINIVLSDNDPNRVFYRIACTVDDVFKRLVSMVNYMSSYDLKVLHAFLNTLDQSQLSKLMLAFNVKLVLTDLVPNEVRVVAEYSKRNPIDFENVTEESLGDFGANPPEEIANEINIIAKMVLDNCVYPFMLNDCEVRAENMERVIVCVTDTDSLMVHFANYVDEFQCRVSNFRDSCILASILGVHLFINNIIPKCVEGITMGCNINDEYYRKKFIFKNEFGFLAMALFAKKMYAASMFVQEGKPRDIHKIAVTGLSFKKRDAAEFLEPIMLELYDKYILTSKDISVEALLDEYYAWRDKLQQIRVDSSYYKVLSVKDISAYDPNKVLPDQMRGSIVWNNLFPDEEILPMDRVIVIPLSFQLLREHASENWNIGEVLRLSLINNENMKYDPVICLPEHYHEVPEWLQSSIDVEYAIDKLLSPFKQILGLFDVNMADTKGGMIASRMIYL